MVISMVTIKQQRMCICLAVTKQKLPLQKPSGHHNASYNDQRLCRALTHVSTPNPHVVVILCGGIIYVILRS